MVRVLVIEDEVRLADAIARGLTAEGFAVEVTHDGLEGLWRAREREYGAIVLDILLPGMNGYAVCRELRAGGVGTPILMLTAKNGEYDEAEGLDIGADDFLSKPFSFVVLVAQLRALLRRRDSPGAAPRVRLGPLELDPGSGSVAWDGAPVELSPREFAVLHALVTLPGPVVAKDALRDRVWGDGEPVSLNVVEVYVGYVRRKLAAAGAVDLVHTERGRGYRIGAP